MKVTAESVFSVLATGAAGDALGNPVEFQSFRNITRTTDGGLVGANGFPKGRLALITDDTQMTMFTMEGMINARRRGTDPVAETWESYQRWLATQSFGGSRRGNARMEGWLIREGRLHASRAPGGTCLSALSGGRPGSVHESINNSKGCGGVMRVAPAAFWSDNTAEVFKLAVGQAALTHTHPLGYLSAGVLAAIVNRLLHGDNLPAATYRAYERLITWSGHELQAELIDRVLREVDVFHRTGAVLDGDAMVDRFKGDTATGGGWVGEEALAIGLYSAFVASDVAHGLGVAVTHGGDSDSTGAVAGNILGAMYPAGSDRGLTSEWADAVEMQDVMVRLSLQFAASL